MGKMIMLQGLPASGKTTWAKEKLKSGNYYRISLKDIERSITGDNSKKKIQNAIRIRNELIENILSTGGNIILDDCNLSLIQQRNLEKLCKRLKAGFEIKSFLHIPVNECIKRDLKRKESVGSKRIQKLYNQYLAPNYQRNLEANWGKKRCVIINIDMIPRLEPNYLFTSIVESLNATYGDFYLDTIILSNEHEKRHTELISWLERHLIEVGKIIMKSDNDFSSASDFKIQKMKEIEDKYAVLGILEINEDMCDLWESKGYNVMRMRGIAKG